MRKIFCFLASLLLIPIFSYAEINGNVENFKNSIFFKKYKFSPDAKPYSINERNFVDFYQKETLDKVMVEFDGKSQKIIKQIGYLKEKEKINDLIVDFISEAVGGKVDNKEIFVLVNEFNAGFKMEGKLDLGGVIHEATKNKKLGNDYVTIEKTILSEYIVTVESGKEYKAQEQEYKEFTQKLKKGDAESFILKGLLSEEKSKGYQLPPCFGDCSKDKQYQEAMEEYRGFFRRAILNYQKAVELAPKNPDANLLLAKACISIDEYENVVTSLETYINLNPDDKYAYYYLGKAYYANGDNQKAEKVLKKGVELIGETKDHIDVDKYQYYSWSYWDEGLPTLYFAINHALGIVLKDLNKYDEAISAYKKVLSMKPLNELSNPEAKLIVELGEIYWLKGDKQEAREQLNILRSENCWKYWADKLEAVMQNKR